MFKRRIIFFALIFALMTGICFAGRTEEPWKVYGVDKPMTRLMSKYYQYPEVKVVAVGQDMHYTDDVSVCLYLARATNSSPFKIRDWRVQSKSWMDIMARLKFHPARLFAPIGGYTAPGAYSHAYREYYKWKSIKNYQMKLYDKEIRNLVQLKFMMKKFRSSPMRVMRRRTAGTSFTQMILKKIK